jgi:bifunctional non-homologous end joining protein LigD
MASSAPLPGDSAALSDLPRESFPEQLAPMLAKMGELPRDGDAEWGYEIKWDGVRVLAHQRRGSWALVSRRGENVTARYPELAALGEQLGEHTAVLDGEVVALDDRGVPSFQLLQSRMGLTSAAAVKQRVVDTPVTFMIFDVPHLDGRCSRELPYERRHPLLESLELAGDHWQTPRGHRGDGRKLLEAAREQGLEGIVAKRLDSPYRPGKRTGEWIKARVWRRQEFVIGGYTPGEGSRANRVGSLLVAYYDKRASELGRGERQRLIFAGGVGSGLKEGEIELLTRELNRRRRGTSPFEVGAPRGPKAKLAVFCEPELVCEAQWTQWTREGTLRQPAFKGMRDDKDPREVVREG